MSKPVDPPISRARVNKILRTLEAEYPLDGKCFLDYKTPWQLLFATILSAQCTDARVNQITPGLFEALPTLESVASADITQIEDLIRTAGFFRTKARHLKGCAEKLIAEFNSELPSEIRALTTLPGVGRKTANVVRSHIFQIPSVTVDTHVLRVSNRLGLVSVRDPTRAEFALMKVLPKKSWISYNQLIITHGRQVCRAQRPLCASCKIAGECKHYVTNI